MTKNGTPQFGWEEVLRDWVAVSWTSWCLECYLSIRKPFQLCDIVLNKMGKQKHTQMIHRAFRLTERHKQDSKLKASWLLKTCFFKPVLLKPECFCPHPWGIFGNHWKCFVSQVLAVGHHWYGAQRRLQASYAHRTAPTVGNNPASLAVMPSFRNPVWTPSSPWSDCRGTGRSSIRIWKENSYFEKKIEGLTNIQSPWKPSSRRQERTALPLGGHM